MASKLNEIKNIYDWHNYICIWFIVFYKYQKLCGLRLALDGNSEADLIEWA